MWINDFNQALATSEREVLCYHSFSMKNDQEIINSAIVCKLMSTTGLTLCDRAASSVCLFQYSHRGHQIKVKIPVSLKIVSFQT